ncbi:MULTISPECIES: hypothetical protein [Alicyclobacillus]|uniref:Uncharacterized protein n=1 Tax=Alicyclobacillus acidoterrestris (strain ATCC 49025 / DSM 3922 / CIP 106132 / NCIMB 13137 / GD3B) TaxID=1356854 RepID=T0BF92_ALIAG|nr:MULTISPECIES: hypothetical protein [Alicyclobacillus]EPZ42648.1 hypothetical protein N007_14525 [Alicyclobacillus acidoterrestris ATCC 49025]UNO47411.1 hypothetical protein K1I37_11830 [Alicyclobacillus acidoterrestris]
MPSGREKHHWSQWFDDWLMPVTFAVVAVLVGVQVVALIPSVRTAIDAKEGRFVAQPTAAMEHALASASAVVTLSASSAAEASHVEVLLNGQSLGTFTTNEMRITVHDGDLIEFDDKSGVAVNITVENTSDNQLLLPAPGQVVTLGGQAKHASLPKAEFI